MFDDGGYAFLLYAQTKTNYMSCNLANYSFIYSTYIIPQPPLNINHYWPVTLRCHHPQVQFLSLSAKLVKTRKGRR